jgi:hypothetical protein
MNRRTTKNKCCCKFRCEKSTNSCCWCCNDGFLTLDPSNQAKQPKRAQILLKSGSKNACGCTRKALCCSIAALQIPDANSFCNSIMRASHRKHARRKSARSNSAHNKRQGRQWESPVGTRRGIICQDLPIPCCKGLEKGCKIAYVGCKSL